MGTRKQINAFLSTLEGQQVLVDIRVKGTKRSADQNAAFHAMIAPWAHEDGHDIDDLKRDLLGIVFGWAESPLSETRRPLKPHTSALTVSEFSTLMERTAEIAAKSGYVLQLPGE